LVTVCPGVNGTVIASIYSVNRTVTVFDTTPEHHCIPTHPTGVKHFGVGMPWLMAISSSLPLAKYLIAADNLVSDGISPFLL
jgi:hypothetical protein